RMPPAAIGPMLVALPGGFEVKAPNGVVTDVAGEAAAPSAFVAGSGAVFPATIDATAQDAFVRRGYTLTSTSPPVDTNNNKADFTYGPAIARALSSTSLRSSWNPSRLGRAVTFTATVAGDSPSGTVEFEDGGKAIGGCRARTLAGGSATCTTTNLTKGSHTITAVYGGDRKNLTSRSSRLTQTVDNVPGAPTGVSATAGNARATVSWSAPASDGGAAITAYTVTASRGSKTCTANGGARRCTVRGLSNGTAYRFTVRATNGVGTGPASPASNAVTPATVPGAPRNASARAGDGCSSKEGGVVLAIPAFLEGLIWTPVRVCRE